MESLQLAQMLADLSDLNAAQESHAAVALVSANKLPVSQQPAVDATKPHDTLPIQKHHQRVGSASGIISRTASPAKFDKFGRRILTPPLTRSNSAQGSGTGTPRIDIQHEDDISQATSLMQLYEIRAKLKQQDNTSLIKLREKIAALQARQHPEKKDGLDAKHSLYTYPKTT